jgi:hypothetical protein
MKGYSTIQQNETLLGMTTGDLKEEPESNTVMTMKILQRNLYEASAPGIQ